MLMDEGNRRRFNTRSGCLEYIDSEGKLHRDNDRPARICKDGIKLWSKHGKTHRENDQPAVIWLRRDGTIHKQSWYQNGERHRGGGKPAVIGAVTNSPNVDEEWWWHGDQKCIRGANGKSLAKKLVSTKPIKYDITSVDDCTQFMLDYERGA